MSKPSVAPPLGTLVALGGGDDDALLALLCDLLPLRDTPVEILTLASPRGAKTTAMAYEKAFRDLGCTAVHYLAINEHYPPDSPASLRRLRRAGLVFFSGGDQELITDFLAGTEFLRVLQERYRAEANFIVAGTSAGAAALSEHMLVDGYGWRALRKGGIRIAPGLGLLPRLLIDQHFVERGRIGRLSHALLAHPMCLGLGLSEETGIIVRRGECVEVFGDGVVMVLDGRQLRSNNLGKIGKGEPVSGENFRLHVLVAGQYLNLATRDVVPSCE